MKQLPNVLIVDDDIEQLSYLKSIMKGMSLNLIQATSGKAALEKTGGTDLAIAILDVRMPGMDGFELGKRINNERPDNQVPLIFLTGDIYIESKILEGYSSGAVDYIFKPVDSQIFKSKIKVFLELFRQKQTILQNSELLKKSALELANANAALKKSERQYRSYIDNAPDGVFVADENGHYIEVNQAACRITGYTKDELLNKSITDLLPSESIKEGINHFGRMVKTGLAKAEMKFRHKNGSDRWWIVESVKLSDSRFLGFTKDITQRKVAEEALLASENALKLQNEELNLAIVKAEDAYEKYSQLYDFAPTGYLTLSSQRTIQDLNLSAAVLLGKDRTHLTGTSFSLFVSGDTLPVFDNFITKLFTNGTTESCELVLHKEGKQPIFVHVEGVVSGDGQQCLINVIDITAHKKADEALQEVSTRLALATRAGGVGVWDFDIAKNLLIWDDHMFQLYGTDKKNFSGSYESWLAGIHPDDLVRSDDEIRKAISGEKEFDTEFRVCWEDGSVHDIRAMAVVLRDSSGTPVHMIGTNWDITKQKNLEEKLKSSESNFRTFFETMNDMIIVGDMAGKVIYVNSAVPAKLGYSRKELGVMSVSGLFPGNMLSEAKKNITEMIDGSRGYATLPFARKDGSLMPVETRIWSGKWNGRDCIFCISKDLSAEQEALQKFNKIFSSNPTLIAISSYPESRFVDINDTFITKLGYSKEDLIGKTSEEIGLFITNDKQKTAASILKKTGTLTNYELRVKTKSGNILEGLFSGDIIESQGKKFYLTVMVDITENKLAEQAMKISEEKYKTMLNASPDGILLINMKGIITEVSEIGLEILGADTRNDLVGKNFYHFVPSDEKSTIAEIIEKTMNEGLAQNIGLKIRKKNNSLFAAETSVTLIQDPNRTPLAYMIILRDISHRRKMEAKQIHADRMANLGEMASGIAHEINQPLNIISMVMDKILFETVKAETIDIQFLKNKSDKIFENITRMRNIIDHIRAFSRSHDDYVSTAFDINTSIKNAVTMIAEQFKHLGINLKLQLDKQIPQMFGNTYKFEQVIVNLLVNAKDAVIEKKNKQEKYSEMTVGITSYQEQQAVIVEVGDNGIGISNDDINNIVLPFYTTKDEGKGTGLGLSICYQIIKEMDGAIEISSDQTSGTKIRLIMNIQPKS